MSWRKKLERFADWDFALQVAFIIVAFMVAGILMAMERCGATRN